MVYSKFQSRQTALFPLGLGYIAAILEGESCDVDLVDCPTEGYGTVQDIGKDRVVYGLTEFQIRQRIEEFRPDAIGISCLFCTLQKQMLMIARIAKEVDPSIVVICGGPHVSAYYKALMAEPDLDYCVVGEGEETTRSLMRALNGKTDLKSVPALCYRQGGKIVIQSRVGYIENLDELPHPARHCVDMETYFRIAEPQALRLDGEQRRRVTQISTSRGCPFQCTYCGKGATWGKSYRTAGAEYVLDEIEYLIRKYNVEHLAIQDDNFTADVERATAICQGMVDRKLNITWEAANGLGANFLNPKLLELMKASGCKSFTIAVESANPEILRRVHKPNYIKLAPPIVQKARELGIEVRGFFMIGFPGETLEQVQNTVRYARELRLAVTNFALVTPFPGTPMFEECVERGLVNLDDMDLEDFTYGSLGVQLSEVSIEQLSAIRKVEWMRGIFLDEHGKFRNGSGLKRRDVFDELAKGRALLPNDPDIADIEAQAKAYFGHGSTGNR